MESKSHQEEYSLRIRSYIFENFVMKGAPEDIPMGESLVDLGILDSYAIVELAMWVENEFKIGIEDEELVRETFGSISLMAQFALRKQAVSAPGLVRPASGRTEQ